MEPLVMQCKNFRETFPNICGFLYVVLVQTFLPLKYPFMCISGKKIGHYVTYHSVKGCIKGCSDPLMFATCVQG